MGTVGSNASIDLTQDQGISAGQIVGAESRTLTEVDGLLYEHPEYQANLQKWIKYERCYESDDIYTYIHKHLRESEDNYKDRVGRGYYYNYCASVVDLFVAYLFHAPITRDPKSLQSEFGPFYENADLAGNKYVYLMQTAATFAQVFGHVGILVDVPRIDEAPASEKERIEKGIRPYCTIVRATQIKDWELDNHGNFEWVKIEIARPEPSRTWNKSIDVEAKNFLIWTRETWEEWRVSGDTATIVAKGNHSLGVVPFVIVRNEKMSSHSWFGSSTIRDISDINLAILNWSSFGDEEIAERCLNILAMERDQGDAPAVLSHSNVLEYAPGASPPQYLQPGSTPLEMIGKWIDRAKDEIYRLAKLGGSTGLLGVREATSGIAYAYEFNETNQSLAKKAESLEQAEVEIHRLVAKWMGKNFDGMITYPKEFGVDDFITEFQILAEARANLTSETALKELEKKLASKLFARDPMDLRAKILEEIKKADLVPIGMSEMFGNVPGAMVREPVADKPGSSSSQAE